MAYLEFDEPFTGPVEVEVFFYVKRPKTTKLEFPKPDLDNYLKAVLDLLQPHVIADDSQVVSIITAKHWTPPNTDPLTLVTVTSLDTKAAPSAEAPTLWHVTQTATHTASPVVITNPPQGKDQ